MLAHLIDCTATRMISNITTYLGQKPVTQFGNVITSKIIYVSCAAEIEIIKCEENQLSVW